MLLLFHDSFFSEKQFFHTSFESVLWHNSYIFGAAISSGDLVFLRSSFFRKETSSQQLFFQNSYFFRAKLLPSSHHLSIGRSLRYLFFGTAIFLEEEFFWTKISTEELLFRSRYFCTTATFSEELHFGKKRIFQKSNIPHYPIFPEICLFREAAFSKDVATTIVATLSEELLFRSIVFQKRYFFTATLLVHSYISYLSVIRCAQCQLHTVKAW